MRILGIETSCDETAAAVVESGTKIISNIVASSQSLHAKYGGIIPDRAAREQLKSIIPVIHECLLQSNQKTQNSRPSENLTFRHTDFPSFPTSPNIDAIAVTIGPGLIGSLLVGVETAKALALAWGKPIVPINHLIGHIYANWIVSEKSETSDSQNIRRPDNLKIRNSETPSIPSFPALVLLVSGGHTELILMKNHGKFQYLGGTRDDAAGECFDKCARILNLGYPGGPAIETAAAKYQILDTKYKILLPRPMLSEDNFDFSFSGLKTAAAYALRSTMNHEPVSTSNYLAYELQEAITDVLVTKTLRAAKKYQVTSILLAGGVAANSRLREKMKLETGNWKLETELYVPDIKLCTDNAAYIASAAFFNYRPIPWQKLDADPSLTIA